MALAGKTSQMSEQMQAYLAGGGNFTDAQGRKLATDFVKQLRSNRDDLVQDRGDKNNGALQYAGTDGHNNPTGIPEEKRQFALNANQQVAAGAKELFYNPRMSARNRDAQLNTIGDAVAEIGKQLGNMAHAGKDQNDALAENQAIATDLNAIKSGKLTADQQNLIYRDILSKSGLINDQLSDLKNETNEALHDSAAIKLGAGIETNLNSALSHPGQSAGAVKELAAAMQQLHSKDGTGVIDLVAADRRLDASLEGPYTQNNKNDSAQLDIPILEFTKPQPAMKK